MATLRKVAEGAKAVSLEMPGNIITVVVAFQSGLQKAKLAQPIRLLEADRSEKSAGIP
jgi:hypothetical protein